MIVLIRPPLTTPFLLLIRPLLTPPSLLLSLPPSLPPAISPCLPTSDEVGPGGSVVTNKLCTGLFVADDDGES